jgi:predicted nuclease of predicted toxin-antitoxin system
VRFLVDANLPPALASWLIERGHAAEHVGDTGEASRADTQIWDEAIAVGYVLVSKDEDFARRRSVSLAGPQVVWIRLGNTRRAALLSHLERVWPQLEAALERGEPLVEVT